MEPFILIFDIKSNSLTYLVRNLSKTGINNVPGWCQRPLVVHLCVLAITWSGHMVLPNVDTKTGVFTPTTKTNDGFHTVSAVRSRRPQVASGGPRWPQVISAVHRWSQVVSAVHRWS